MLEENEYYQDIKLYSKRNTINQGAWFFKHMGAMTAEELHDKSDIAAELAHRDIEIYKLTTLLEQYRERLDQHNISYEDIEK